MADSSEWQRVVACDPGVRLQAFALAKVTGSTFELEHVWTLKSTAKRRGWRAVEDVAEAEWGSTLRILSESPPDVVIVEGQHLLESKSKPEDILRLAHAAGIVTGRLSSLIYKPTVLTPTPQEWSQVPKDKRHNRVALMHGIDRNTLARDYGITKTQGEHCMDAVSMIHWFAKNQRKLLKGRA